MKEQYEVNGMRKIVGKRADTDRKQKREVQKTEAEPVHLDIWTRSQ